MIFIKLRYCVCVFMACVMQVYITKTAALTSEEVCVAELFKPSCAADEVIIMESAVYGRMAIGRCVKNDYGHLGCHNDALQSFDAACSGHRSCDFAVSTDLRRDVSGACGPAIFGYVEASYNCREVFQITRDHCINEVISLPPKHILMSSAVIKSACNGLRSFKVYVNQGQTMNISIWKFDGKGSTLGRITDLLSNNIIDIVTSSRHRHLMTTVGNTVAVALQATENNLIFEIDVIGCGDVTPPEGAWMTRDGDVIEIGCHSGSKTWTLQCENNKWVGVIGYCGQDSLKDDKEEEDSTIKPGSRAAVWSISLNVLVFGVSSLIILCSACIFLAGVIVLKRKLVQRRDYTNYPFTTLSMAPNVLLEEPSSMDTSITKPATAHDKKQLMYTMTSLPAGAQQVYNNIDG